LEDRRLLATLSAGIQLFNASPALFVENEGQWSDSTIHFVHHGDGATVAMSDTGPVFQLFRHAATGDATETERVELPSSAHDSVRSPVEMVQFSADFVGANAITPVGEQRSEALFNYFVGDPSTWRSDVPGYEVVTYPNLYDGIDLRTFGQRSHLKYEFHVAPGADYSQIAVHYTGIEGLSLAEDASLRVSLGGDWGEMIDGAPYAYQVIDGQEVAVASRYVLVDEFSYAFEITGSIDAQEPLVIDPDLAWSTYLGSGGMDDGRAIAVDAAGNVYVAGGTDSSAFPTTVGALATTSNGGQDVFVAKLNPSGSALVYSTYLGGSNRDFGLAIAVDASGNAYVTGLTDSTDFATTVGALDTTYNGTTDAFVAKLNATGDTLLYSTYLGGANHDYGRAIAVDVAGNAYVTGDTDATDFPAAGAFDTTHNGSSDVFLSKLNPSGGALVYSTYLGGSSSDVGFALALDAAWSAYVTGITASTDFPTTGGAVDTTHNGSYDVFVAKVNADGRVLAYSTYLGGDGSDSGNAIAVDASGNAYVTGSTGSSAFPTTAGAVDTTHNGSSDVFVAKIIPSGRALTYST